MTQVVHWRDCADSSGSWRVLHPAPSGNRGFTETGRYVFESPGPGWNMTIDDEPPVLNGGGSNHWSWTPGFYAGEVTAELTGSEPCDRTLLLLDVAPDPAKVGREVFDAMLHELWREDPGFVLGAEPATVRVGELGQSQSPWLAFARLRRYCPDFLVAAGQIQARPRRALRAQRASVAPHQARRVDHHTASVLARSAASGVLLAIEGKAAPHTAVHLNVPVTEETLDSSANRTLLALLLALLRRVRTTTEQLEELVQRERRSDTETPLGPRWPIRRQVLDGLATRLKALVRQSPFRDATRAEVSAAGLTAIAADPVYARAWSRGWRALRRGVASDTTAERFWVSPTWEIYERWCFVRLGTLLRSKAPEWSWRRLGDGWAGAHDGRRAELRLQPKFASRSENVAGPWSVSRERVPDLVLTVISDAGTRFVVLDAKYRTSRANVLDAMASAHIYQDSLRMGARRPEATLLLVPSGGGAPWLEAAAFQDAHRVGVHAFSPGDTADCPQVVTDLLNAGH
jgi:hypothetical protein